MTGLLLVLMMFSLAAMVYVVARQGVELFAPLVRQCRRFRLRSMFGLLVAFSIVMGLYRLGVHPLLATPTVFLGAVAVALMWFAINDDRTSVKRLWQSEADTSQWLDRLGRGRARVEGGRELKSGHRRRPARRDETAIYVPSMMRRYGL